MKSNQKGSRSRKSRQGAWFSRVSLMEICNEFGRVPEFGSEDPRGLFVGALVTCPTDKV